MNGTHKAILSEFDGKTYYCPYCFQVSATNAEIFSQESCPNLRFSRLASRPIIEFADNVYNITWRGTHASNCISRVITTYSQIDYDAFDNNEEKFMDYFYGEFLDKWTEIATRGPFIDETSDIDCSPFILMTIKAYREAPVRDRNLRKYLPKTLLREEEEAAARAAEAMLEYGNAAEAAAAEDEI